ncbi:TlpA family protein disulfide reductase [Nigerium massiliense]|uniref:TlpA family protein disulfide reductase n=1 Tax=Nigerium massiliense TaxID=1522317 RepID=UPI0006935078|nr:TlpA disulfide reductase family protein [Nigerium massiliense]
MRRAAIAVALAAALALSGCSGAAGPNANPATSGGGGLPAPVTSASKNPNTETLVAQRKAAGIADCTAPAPGAPHVDYGLPNVSLPCLGSDRWVNLADLRGKPMVVNLWAQWCEPCRAEAPYLRALAARSAGKLDVLGVDIVDPEPVKAIAFAKASGWTYPHLVDPDGVLSRTMQVPGIPVSLFVNAEGRVVYRHTGGFTSAEQMEQLVHDQLGVTLT